MVLSLKRIWFKQIGKTDTKNRQLPKFRDCRFFTSVYNISI